MPTPVERATLLKIPPLLSRMVVSDAMELEFTNWDHLAMCEIPPKHRSCKACRPSARRIWLNQNPDEDKSACDSLSISEKKKFKKIAKAERARYEKIADGRFCPAMTHAHEHGAICVMI